MNVTTAAEFRPYRLREAGEVDRHARQLHRRSSRVEDAPMNVTTAAEFRPYRLREVGEVDRHARQLPPPKFPSR